MPLFKRKDKTTIAELEDYYANNKRNRSGMAWFMAFLSLLITVLVIVGLFFLGRWVWDTLTDNNGSEDVGIASGADQDATDASLPSYDTDAFNDNDNSSGEVAGDESSSASDVESTEGGVVSDEAASITVDESEYDSSSTVAGSSTGGETGGESTREDLPDTGAGEALLIAPVVAGVAGYAISRKRQLR